MRPVKCFAFACRLMALWIASGQAQVKINEVMINDAGTDDSTYVELWGPGGTVLTGYQLVGINGCSGQTYATIDLAGVIPSDGFFVIGETAMPGVDLVNVLVDLRNGPDNLHLLSGGSVMDALGYGDFASPDTVFRGEGSPAPNQVPGASLCRNPDGHDTGNNADDFELTPFLTPGEPNEFPGVIPFYTLAEIRTQQTQLLGQLVWTTGLAISPSGLFGGVGALSAYLQDDQAGINLYGGSASFAVGDCLWVKATVGQYNYQLELTDALEIHVGPNARLPDPITVNCQIVNAAGENLEGMLVVLGDVWITDYSAGWPAAGADSNLTITDSTGETTVMRIDKDTELDGWTDHPEPWEHFSAIGIVNQFGSNYQVLPRFREDFGEPLGVADRCLRETPSAFRLEGAFPNPFNPSTKVHFSLSRPGEVRLEAFTLEGRRAAILLQGWRPAGTWSVTWEASGQPSGIYLLRLVSAAEIRTAKALLLK